MNAGANKLQKALENETMFSLVNSYLKAKAIYEVTRERVDVIHAQILAELDVRNEEGKLITKADNLYRCDDDELCQKFYGIADERLKADGIKPADMERDYCPALVAESDLRDISHEIVRVSGEAMGLTLSEITGSLEIYKKWLDTVIKGVVNCSKFQVA